MVYRIAVVLFALALGAQERQVVYDLDSRLEAMGESLAKEVRQQTTPVDSPAALAYTEALGRKLAPHLPDGRFSWRFALVRSLSSSRTHEPAWLPGGYIFVPADLILTAESEAEFAGMLAHAMAHSAARHGSRASVSGQNTKLSSVPLVFIGGWNGVGESSLLVPMGFLKIYREYELEADTIAARAMAGAGYDPGALERYIERTQRDPEGPKAEYSALPAKQLRLAEFRRTIEELPARDYPLDESEFRSIQEQVRAIAPRLVDRPPTLRR